MADEKERSFQVLLESMIHQRNFGKGSNPEESQETQSDGDSKQKKKKKKKKRRVVFDDDSEESDLFGKDSDDERSSSAKKRVKSGAEIKKRPVVRTELWPHTIANEENGDKDEVNSENINLSEFLTCFQYIVVNAKSKV